LAFLVAAWSVGAAPARLPQAIVAEHCATCHHATLVGNPGPNLLDALWTHGWQDADIIRNINQGFPASGMPAFAGVLTDEEIRGVVAYIRAQSREYAAGRITHPRAEPSVLVKSERQTFRLETYVEGLETAWGLAFLPDGRLLVTEREGRLRVIRDGRLEPQPVAGTPAVFHRGDAGLLDVIAHPDFARNGWIYLAYCEPNGQPETGMTVIVRGRVRDGRWVDAQEIFRAPAEHYFPGITHFGCRFLFDGAGHLFFTLGDRGRPEAAQDRSSPLGKIHRVNDDGSIPADNPFVGQKGACRSVYSYGHRHPQGLEFHPVTGRLWATEHGPTGGDELNRVEPGHNYGWPLASDGTERGRVFARALPGMDSPVVSWTPTIAPAAITFCTSARYPAWRNHLFVACLGGEQLRRIETDGDRVVHQEVLFKHLGRVRDVTVGPDGLIYLAMNNPGRVARLVPVAGDLERDGR
jgi:glucose/arabinose dehydrogenase